MSRCKAPEILNKTFGRSYDRIYRKSGLRVYADEHFSAACYIVETEFYEFLPGWDAILVPAP